MGLSVFYQAKHITAWKNLSADVMITPNIAAEPFAATSIAPGCYEQVGARVGLPPSDCLSGIHSAGA